MYLEIMSSSRRVVDLIECVASQSARRARQTDVIDIAHIMYRTDVHQTTYSLG